VTTIGAWRAALVSNQRGPLVTRTAATREQAIAVAQRLLEHVAADLAWLRGEKIIVEIEVAGQVFAKYGSKIRPDPLGNGVFGQAQRSPDQVGGGEGRSGPRRVAVDSASQLVCPNTVIVGLLQ
jgi:hypothetical protein